jgi:HEAT repeat protein
VMDCNSYSDNQIVRCLDSKCNAERWSAIYEAGARRLTEAVPALVAILRSSLPTNEVGDVRLIAARALAQLGWREFYPYLETMLKGSSLERLGLADLLGEARDTRGLPALVKLTHDSDDEVVLWAIGSLAKFGPPAVPLLGRMLQYASTFRQRALLLDALSKTDCVSGQSVSSRYLNELPAGEATRLRALLNEVDA